MAEALGHAPPDPLPALFPSPQRVHGTDLSWLGIQTARPWGLSKAPSAPRHRQRAHARPGGPVGQTGRVAPRQARRIVRGAHAAPGAPCGVGTGPRGARQPRAGRQPLPLPPPSNFSTPAEEATAVATTRCVPLSRARPPPWRPLRCTPNAGRPLIIHRKTVSVRNLITLSRRNGRDSFLEFYILWKPSKCCKSAN